VRVRSYVIERPVSESVNLHSETVQVERRPVDRAIGAGEDAFQERTIEAQATSEEAVVAKEARVTGEVLVRKEGSDRTETVKDKVRSTKVDVDDERRTGTTNPRGRGA
jgi:stress response protein YsnF